MCGVFSIALAKGKGKGKGDGWVDVARRDEKREKDFKGEIQVPGDGGGKDGLFPLSLTEYEEGGVSRIDSLYESDAKSSRLCLPQPFPIQIFVR